jgi:hypothetical protein
VPGLLGVILRGCRVGLRGFAAPPAAAAIATRCGADSAIDGGNKTVNNVLSTLNKALRTAVEWKVIRVMPCTIRLLKVAPPEMSF